MQAILLQGGLFHFSAAVLYLGLAAHFWRSRWRGAALDAPIIGLRWSERLLIALALVCHGISLFMALFPVDAKQMHFGFSVALSMMTWLAIAFYWVESFYARMEGLQVIVLPLAALCALLPLWLPGQHVIASANTFAFRFHFLLAMLAYSLFTLAALQALLMAATERRLHRGRMTPLFAGLPPLLTMEALLFRLLHVAFILLTITLISGAIFSEHIFGKALPFTHKTVFALISWLIFAALLFGRWRFGWRGRRALYWTLTGFIALLLAYVGSRFVLEVLLHRPA
ncbi:MAG: cytochrome c biogenesis protein CcsA [Rhodocyclaceae bacterium]|nr:cytochrome c biogenesis protein CcsA [Rhodocyclaceae bacterium]